MNKIRHILTSEEKEIIENHFIFNRQNAKKNFLQFCVNTINKYSEMGFDIKNVPRNPDYSIDLIWEDSTNTTAIMHCFSHPRYAESNSKFKFFKFFNPDLKLKDINNETAVMKLGKNVNNISSVSMIVGVDSNSVDYGYDFNDFNNDGDNLISISLKSFKNILYKKTPKMSQIDVIEILSVMEKVVMYTNIWCDNNANINQEKNKEFLTLSKEYVSILKEKFALFEKGLFQNFNYQYINNELLNADKKLTSNLLNINLHSELNSNEKMTRKLKI